MLERLSIRNFALIEDLSLDFCDNLNILTGETGAGKSIVIDAVGVLLGGRAQTELIRSGSEKAYLEATVRLSQQHQVFELLAELGVETEEGTLVLAREIAVNGRNSSRINGRSMTLSQYKQIGLAIVDIHGQHDHQNLLNHEHHIEILDKFGGNKHLSSVRFLKDSFAGWQGAARELSKLRSQEQERLQRLDFLRYQIQEIEQAKLREGETADLAKEAGILANAEKIVHNLNSAYAHLFGGERGLSAYDSLSKALGALREVGKYDPSLEQVVQQLEPLVYQIEDSSAEIRRYQEGIEYSPQRLEQVEKRWQYLKDLAKKYGPEEADILAFAQKARLELEAWEHSGERAAELEGIVLKARQEYENLAAEVAGKRKEIARLLEEKVVAELLDLAMPHVRFAVSFTAGEPGAKGLEEVEFLISPNPGEPLLPVSRIASGGELSRIMLALKTIIAHLDGIGTLIFDEIDTGLGGKAVQKLADKLAAISLYQQVICVTHSPLVAAVADRHLLLEKEIEGGRTRTTVRILEQDERVEELVRMLGGDKPTEELKSHARQIMKKTKI